MDNSNISKHPVHALLDEIFAKAEIEDVVTDFRHRNSGNDKWLLFSDYCLDDKNKANDVMTFVLMPFESEEKFLEMQKQIKTLQPSDIKKTDTVNKDFLLYLKNESVLTFSFVFNDRKYFFGESQSQRVQNIKDTLQIIRDCYEGWKITTDNNEIQEYYDDAIKKFNRELTQLNGKNPNIKLLNDILITAFLGAYVSVKVLEKLPIEIFGWFSDRDKVISGKDNIIVPIFNFYQHNMLSGHQFQFCTFTPNDRVKPFYDDFNRIADVVVGTIADYNIEEDYITADKFNTVLVDFLADNKQALTFRIYTVDNIYHVSQIMMHPKLRDCLFKRMISSLKKYFGLVKKYYKVITLKYSDLFK